MHQNTKAILSGKDIKGNKGTVNTPIHKTSTVLFPTLQDYHNAERGVDYHKSADGIEADLSYGITGTPTTFALQKSLAEMEGADAAIVVPSGLSAITTAILAFVKTGDHILMVDTVYGPTRRFCNKELRRLGIKTTYYDPLIGSKIKDLIQPNTKIVFTESPGSLTFEVQDIPAIAKEAHNKGAVVIIDNSWATALYFKPFEHGVDVSIQAGTKYIGGYSDVFLGTITTTKHHYKRLYDTYKHYGLSVAPEVCYMAHRGLKTMPTRVKAVGDSALVIAKWLKKHKKVQSVLHPAFSSCPGHKLFKRDFTGSSGLFSIVLDKEYSLAQLSSMIDNFEIFGIGSSWGGFESLAINFDPSTIRTATNWTEKRSCVRLYIGLEDTDDLISDLDAGLRRLG